MSKYFIISLHDFHPGSCEAIREQVDFFEKRGVGNFSILVVPHFHRERYLTDDEVSLEFLEQRRQAGDDLVLHGFYHRGGEAVQGGVKGFFLDRFYTTNEAEFRGLSVEEFRMRVEKGMGIWEMLEWDLDGFIAPAWLMPEAHDCILKEYGFLYTTRLKHIELLTKGERVATQSLCYSSRSWWRRRVSLWWNQRLYKELSGKGKGDGVSVIRLSMHPDDLKWDALRKQIGEITEMILADGYEPVTYAAYATL